MKRLGKSTNPAKETVEAYCLCVSAEDYCLANCFGNSSAQSYSYQYYYTRVPYVPTAHSGN